MNPLTKGELSSKLSTYLIINAPDTFYNGIKQTAYKEAYGYYRGYFDCWKNLLEHPVERPDAHDFILQQTTEYFLKLL